LARKILLADDSVTAQNMGRKILTDAGYEVITVNNGSAALKKIAEGKPDLIVLDVYMPGYSGLEVCQRIKENRETSRIPILLTVGKLEPFKPEEARRAKADAFVVKPFEASELLTALTKLEDKIIPGAEPYKPGRFAKAIATVERETDSEEFGDLDEGWKARLRIPTGKSKDDVEPPVDYAATQGKGFRDFIEPPMRKTTPKPVPPAFERQVPAGLPHDITPEEIAAITAAAAQLKGGPSAPPAEPVAGAEPAEGHKLDAAATELTPSPAEADSDESAPVTFATAPEDETEPVAEPSPPDLVIAAQTPVEPTETYLAVESPAVPEIPLVAEAPALLAAVPETIETAPAVEPAPPEPPATRTAAETIEPAPIAASEPVDSAALASTEPVIESPAVTVAAAAEPAASEPETIAPADASVPSPAIPESAASVTPTPSADDEVMAALHALIPADSNSGQSAAVIETPGDAEGSDSAASFSSEESNVPAPGSGPRWVAEEVALSDEEISPNLDREMEVAALAAQATPEPSPVVEAVAQEQPVADAVAAATQPLEQEAPEVFAVATAAGAEFPAPWPVGNPPRPPDAMVEARSTQTVETIAEPVVSHVAPAEEELRATIQTVPVEGDIMAASWKNIRDSIASSAAKPALAKEELVDAAARTEVASSDAAHSESATAADAGPRPGANDPTAIANIVESVLAELRPKIVEEIARKLSDPKK
jgi:twitching motility two-component system response regulator PilH